MAASNCTEHAQATAGCCISLTGARPRGAQQRQRAGRPSGGAAWRLPCGKSLQGKRVPTCASAWRWFARWAAYARLEGIEHENAQIACKISTPACILHPQAQFQAQPQAPSSTAWAHNARTCMQQYVQKRHSKERRRIYARIAARAECACCTRTAPATATASVFVPEMAALAAGARAAVVCHRERTVTQLSSHAWQPGDRCRIRTREVHGASSAPARRALPRQRRCSSGAARARTHTKTGDHATYVHQRGFQCIIDTTFIKYII